MSENLKLLIVIYTACSNYIKIILETVSHSLIYIITMHIMTTDLGTVTMY